MTSVYQLPTNLDIIHFQLCRDGDLKEDPTFIKSIIDDTAPDVKVTEVEDVHVTGQ